MQIHNGYHIRLPDSLRGICLAHAAPETLIVLSGCCAALAIGTLLRSMYDVAVPLPVDDIRETARTQLQWGVMTGLALLFVLGLHGLEGGAIVPDAAQCGPLLRVTLGGAGLLLAVRALVRMQLALFQPIPSSDIVSPGFDPDLADGLSTGLLDENLHGAGAMPLHDELRTGKKPVGSNVPVFTLGLLMLGTAIAGWRMDSLCLFRTIQ